MSGMNVAMNEKKKLIKHPSPRLVSSDKTAVYVSVSTPFVSALKRVTKLLNESNKAGKKSSYVSVFGLGKAMDKALAIGLKFQTTGHEIQVLTGTVTVTDEIDSEKEEPVLTQRQLSNVEVRIMKMSL
jgi:hypothetical protein